MLENGANPNMPIKKGAHPLQSALVMSNQNFILFDNERLI